MDDLKREKIQYAHRKVQHLAVELMKVQRIFRENDSSIKNELISNAVMQLIKLHLPYSFLSQEVISNLQNYQANYYKIHIYLKIY